jgi:hypothetical protein
MINVQHVHVWKYQTEFHLYVQLTFVNNKTIVSFPPFREEIDFKGF